MLVAGMDPMAMMLKDVFDCYIHALSYSGKRNVVRSVHSIV
jgi:hypothetical protein